MMSEPSPARVGMNGSRCAAASRPNMNMPSSYSVNSMVPRCRALRKCGSSGTESSVTNGATTRRTFPVAHSRPTSGPPYDTSVRSRRSERKIARTRAIGLRREPQPPIPIVMPLSSDPTMSSIETVLSVVADVADVAGVTELTAVSALLLGDEVVAVLVTGAHQVELEREALLVAVAAVNVDRVDAVQRLLGPADDVRVLVSDLGGDGEGGVAQPVTRNDLEHGAEGVEFGGRDVAARVDHRAHQVLGHQPGQMGGRAERATVDLGQP